MSYQRIATTDVERLQQRVEELEVRLSRLENVPPTEPPPPVWKDISHQCHVTEDGLAIMDGSDQVAFIVSETDRFTRISGPLTPHVAFIVEKQE